MFSQIQPRLCRVYKSTTDQAVAMLRATTPTFWHWFSSQELPALGQVLPLPTTPGVLVPWTRISNSQHKKHLHYQLLTLQLQPSWHLKHLMLELCWSRVCTLDFSIFQKRDRRKKRSSQQLKRWILRTTLNPCLALPRKSPSSPSQRLAGRNASHCACRKAVILNNLIHIHWAREARHHFAVQQLRFLAGSGEI